MATTRRVAARDRGMRVRPAARPPRLRLRPCHNAGAARRRRGRRAGRGRGGVQGGWHHAARVPAGAAPGGRVDVGRILRAPRHARPVAGAARVGRGAAPAELGLRGRGARPRAAPGGPIAARRARARAAAGALRQFARPRRGAVDRAAATPDRPLARRALQARRGGHLAGGARRRGRGNGRGRHDRLQGSVQPGGQGSRGAGRAVRPRRWRRSRTPTSRTPTTCPGSRRGSPITSRACPTTRRSTLPTTSARHRWPGGW